VVGTPRNGYPTGMRTLTAAALLAALTVATWLVVLPWTWTLVPGEEPATYTTAVPTWRFVVVAVVLVALAVASGAMGHPVLPVPAVAGPAVVLWCYQAANAETVGANLWVVGAIVLVPVAVVGALLAGFVGSRLRRHPVAA
jgi:hypothetical protein